MQKMPQISVNMIAYNDEKYISEAIQAVLSQSFEDFEFIIVDDASSDNTHKIIEEFASQDKRISFYTNEKNMGRPYSRNKALQNSKGTYVAIIDSDDYMLKDRLLLQYNFMSSHPKVLVCGSQVESYETGELFRYSLENEEIRVNMLFDSPIANPAAIFRRTSVLHLTGGYDLQFFAAQDYDLWERISHTQDAEFANISDVLIRYRTHPERQAARYKSLQIKLATKVRENQILWMGITPTYKELIYHNTISGYPQKRLAKADILGCVQWAEKLLRANKSTHRYDQRLLRRRIERIQHYFSVLYANILTSL